MLERHRLIGRALGRGLRLLARSQWGEIRYRLLRALDHSTNTASDNYRSNLDYQSWRRQRELEEADRDALRRQAAAFPDPPLISVLLPVCDPAVAHLRAALDSVICQLYPHWELCIADDASTDVAVRRTLEEYQLKESRIRLTRRASRGGIAAASNAALALASGSYVALLDHDDLLAEHALLQMARAIARHPDIDALYSDQDKLDEQGQHVEPYFKPDWSPEMFLGYMYLCHLMVLRRSMIEEVGGFRSAFDGAQDYDLALRVAALTQRIAHIPDVLYHWRKVPGSTAVAATAKPQAVANGQCALAEFLKTTEQVGQVEMGPAPGLYRVRFAILDQPRVSIIIPTACRSTADGTASTALCTCLASIRHTSTYRHYELILIHPDQAITPELANKLAPYQLRCMSYGTQFNWARAMNCGAAAAAGQHLVFLNDDTEVITPDWIESMLEFSQQPGVGAVGARLLFPSGDLQHAGIIVAGGVPRHVFYRFHGDHGGYFSNNLVTRNCTAVTGACLMTQTEWFWALGGFDESYELDCSDIDYCLRTRERGARVVWTPHAKLYHHEALTRTGTRPEEQERFHARWAHLYPHDPYYNPNLEPRYGDYRIDLERYGAAEKTLR
ncbi:hypothetical protein AYO44_16740 [Planctomycetaceae bacterium SCGC AG-212-F19]|nr:hypothetical protein AYO44_16740 [Planctomycetaceae bacterium SCGC AG-212-F19]